MTPSVHPPLTYLQLTPLSSEKTLTSEKTTGAGTTGVLLSSYSHWLLYPDQTKQEEQTEGG